ncbi:MAG: energy transducer TonB [Acidobacteriota bacterium]
MNLGRESSSYRKVRLRSEQSRRWAKMRKQRDDAPPEPQSHDAAAMVSEYLVGDDEDSKSLKWAGVAAIIAHFILFLVVIPVAQPEPVEYERTAAVVVKRYQPPSPPAKAKKTKPKKKKTRVPIPDPTPDEPEPIEIEETGDYEYGEFDADYMVGAPDGVPGVSSGARDGAFRAGEGGIISPEILRQVDPEYTPEATRRGIQGEVWIEAVVDAQGRVQDPRLLRGLPDEELNQRAMEAIRRWEFRPGTKDGEPVPVIAVFTVTYRLH